MFKEFFAPDPKRACGGVTVAWGGLLLVILHAFLHGYVKWRLNKFFGSFYNVLQTSGAIAVNASATTEDWEAGGDAVMRELVEFCKIAAIAIAVMPFTKLIRSLWVLEWRIQLSKYYLDSWDANFPSIEGASQRLQEDTFKFTRGIETCLTVGLDVLVSLVIFVPVLIQLGAKVVCPEGLDGFLVFAEGWLAAMAIIAAVSGFVVTFVLGTRLVLLEVENQRVEANFRTDLVILECTPHNICQHHHVVNNDEEIPQVVLLPPAKHFKPLIKALLDNYRNLYVNFFTVNLWLATYDQFMVILPYLLAAPRLFDANAETRILLGTLVQVSNAYDKVFTAMNTISENWLGITEFRSVLVRLRQFEANLYNGVPVSTRAAMSSGCLPSRGVPAEVVGIELVQVEEVVSQTRV
jgi:peptide/bleomycin uptake transporter